MCGISGKINYSQNPNLENLLKINNKLYHRGPDDGDVINLDDIAALGHRRLSIIDLSNKAHQPMQDRTKRYTITYNGEVYNFKELRKELETAGYQFASTSDTEVVLYSFIHWGVKCFKKFNGMFALAIWDSKEKELIMARDKFGKKPLYYTLLNNELTFASELTGLLEDSSIRERAVLSVSAITHYLAIGYILSPLTIYNEILKLEPSTYMKFKDGRIVEKARYWEYKDYFYNKTNQSREEIIENLEYLFDKAVRYRLISDVPVGAFLSGGVDSSGVVAFAKKYMGNGLKTFSLGFVQDSYSELDDAKRISDYLCTIHHGKISEVDNNISIIDRGISCYDEPFSDTSLIPMVEISELVSGYVKVVLSGDGADEIFAGYETYKADVFKRKFDILPRLLINLTSTLLDRIVKESNSKKVGTGFKLRQFSKGLASDYRYAHYAWRELYNEQERIDLIGSEHKEEIQESSPYFKFENYYNEVSDIDHLSQHLYVDAKTWLADDILVKVDRATMAFSIEARCPFLDSELVEYAASIPSKYKMNKLEGKYILKKMLEKYLPTDTVYKRKSGFNAPVNIWLENRNENEHKFFNKYVLRQKKIYLDAI
ncbi:MAG: asparagine synthase (glutamine-hydrolyzing) [bacterium]|nr:asparagine synthase (glutamine-hydrolyzing) [bacterium]